MTPAFLRALSFALILMAGQRLAAQMPMLGYLVTLFPVTWALWAWSASRLVAAGRDHLATRENPQMSALGWGVLLGCLAGLSSAVLQIIAGSVVTLVGTAALQTAGPAAGLTAASGALTGLGGFLALFTRPMFGMLVAGAAAFIFAGNLRKTAGPAAHSG